MDLNIVIVYMLIVFISFLIYVLLKADTESKDEFLVTLSVLERVIDDYVQIVYNPKVEFLRLQHNLNPDSKLNSIKSFEIKVNEILKLSTLEIMNLLTKHTKKKLLKRFYSRSLALFISNKIRNS